MARGNLRRQSALSYIKEQRNDRPVSVLEAQLHSSQNNMVSSVPEQSQTPIPTPEPSWRDSMVWSQDQPGISKTELKAIRTLAAKPIDLFLRVFLSIRPFHLVV